jgi:hypothetical protein
VGNKNDTARPLVIAGERVGDLIPSENGLAFYSTRPELKALSGRLFPSESEAVKVITRSLREYQLSA